MATSNNNGRAIDLSTVASVSNPDTGARLMAVSPAGQLTPVTIDSLMEMVRGSIQVGGRNLIPDSDVRTVEARDNDYNYRILTNGLKIKAGESLSASFGSMSVTSGKTGSFNLSVMTADLKTLVGRFDLSPERRASTIKARIDCEDGVVLLYAGLAGSTSGIGITVTELKLERGNVVSDWTPAPEDLMENRGG